MHTAWLLVEIKKKNFFLLYSVWALPSSERERDSCSHDDFAYQMPRILQQTMEQLIVTSVQLLHYLNLGKNKWPLTCAGTWIINFPYANILCITLASLQHFCCLFVFTFGCFILLVRSCLRKRAGIAEGVMGRICCGVEDRGRFCRLPVLAVGWQIRHVL